VPSEVRDGAFDIVRKRVGREVSDPDTREVRVKIILAGEKLEDVRRTI
jgi:hypothetical protein